MAEIQAPEPQTDAQPEIDDTTVIKAAVEHYMADLTRSWEGYTPIIAKAQYPKEWNEFVAISEVAERIMNADRFEAFLA